MTKVILEVIELHLEQGRIIVHVITFLENDIAGLIAPRDLLIVNGDKDHFFSSDAKKEIGKLKNIYAICNSENNFDFKEPQGVGHEFSTNIAIAFFNKVFKLQLNIL